MLWLVGAIGRLYLGILPLHMQPMIETKIPIYFCLDDIGLSSGCHLLLVVFLIFFRNQN